MLLNWPNILYIVSDEVLYLSYLTFFKEKKVTFNLTLTLISHDQIM